MADLDFPGGGEPQGPDLTKDGGNAFWDGAGQDGVDAALDGSPVDTGFGDAKNTDKDATPPGPKYAAEVRTDRPVGYWRLGEPSGTASRDEIAGNAGTYEQGVFLGAAGVVSNDTAARFDGQSGSRVRVGDVFDFSGKAPCTLEAWVKWDGGNAAYIIAKKSAIDGTGYLLLVNPSPVASNQAIWIYTRTLGDRTDVVSYTTSVSTKFAHVVATFDGMRGRIFYNGVEAASASFGLSILGTGATLSFGANSGGDHAFKGSLDEIAIYDRALTADRIQAHYNAANSK
ncbi:LamG domain-containing protein [Pendulispora brunnea]|uniref:LamG domain-containing protein n=1 Tax=Pendulispora brunnea TaxID=2905690 RepID=A0ABZ2K9S6_9BACT